MHIHQDIEYRTVAERQRCRIFADQIHRFEDYAAEIFTVLGKGLDAPSIENAPRRFIKALFDATEGYDSDPKLLRVFETSPAPLSGAAITRRILYRVWIAAKRELAGQLLPLVNRRR